MSTKIKIFDLFITSLKETELSDKEVFTWKNNRLSLTHCLARHLEEAFKDYDTDMCPNLSKSKKVLNPDILVHNRKTNKKALAIVCRNDYLSEEDQQKLINLSILSKSELTMAVSFFPTKNYMLLYRAFENTIEYYHFDRNTLTCETVRKKTASNETVLDKNQLELLN